MAVALTCNVLSIVEIGNVTCCLHWQDVNIDNTKLLQKREMRKDIVIELSYKGFSRASDYS